MNQHNQEPVQAHASYDERYTAYQTNRSALRRLVRRHYLNTAARLSVGPALDFGCGTGELLRRLPKGSIGIEYNQSTVAHCQNTGLDVVHYDGFKDDFSLSTIAWRGRVSTLFLSHVLEHFDDPTHVLCRIARSVESDIERIVIIVPGKAGFRIDPTHRTFVDECLLEAAVAQLPHWRVTSSRYFPFNLSRAGDYFAHNELQVVLDRQAGAPLNL